MPRVGHDSLVGRAPDVILGGPKLTTTSVGAVAAGAIRGAPWRLALVTVPDSAPARQDRSSDTASLTLTVRLLGELKRLAGRPEVELRLPAGSTLHALTAELARLCDPAFAQTVLSRDGDIQSHVAVFLNGSQLPSAGEVPLPLTDGEVEFLFVPMYEGG